MTNLTFDAAQCFLMFALASRILRSRPDVRLFFWRTLPESLPDLTAHLPALTEAVRRETDLEILDILSSHPLPATLSPEAVDWRTRLFMVWEKRRKTAREALDSTEGHLAWERGYSSWIQEYISALKGLVQVDTCGMPSGMKCPSVLPTLLNEACYVKKEFMRSKPSYREWVTQSKWLSEGLECLAALSGWRPASNIVTDPTILKAWGDFWLELYQKAGLDAGEDEPDAQIIRKGIAAKAILNLIEAGGEEDIGIPAGMETPLLKSLTMAIDVTGESTESHRHLGWMNWQPQDVTRFPTNSLVEVPKTLLKRFSLSCQQPDRWWDKELPVLHVALEELVRWERAGLLAACGIDLLPCIMTDLGYYLNSCIDINVQSSDFLNHKLYRWLIRPEVAAVEEGREILQKLEDHWQDECKPENSSWRSRLMAWEGRILLQRAGLATETAASFHESLLKAINNERFGEVRLVLSLWRPDKNTSNTLRDRWEHQWQEALNSKDEEISESAALFFVSPDPADDIVVRQQKLRNVLRGLPGYLRPKLSITEITHLMGKSPLETANADSGAVPDPDWQFKPDEMRFHMPTEHIASTSTPVQTVRPDKTAQSSARSEPQSGR